MQRLQSFLFLSLLLTSCSGSGGAIEEPPNDAAFMQIRVNPVTLVSYSFVPLTLPATLVPYQRVSEDNLNEFNEGDATDDMMEIEQMFQRYFRQKFVHLDSSGPVKIDIRIEDYRTSAYNTGSSGSRIVENLVGDQVRWSVKPKLKASVRIESPGYETVEKILEVTIEDHFANKNAIFQAQMLRERLLVRVNQFLESESL